MKKVINANDIDSKEKKRLYDKDDVVILPKRGMKMGQLAAMLSFIDRANNKWVCSNTKNTIHTILYYSKQLDEHNEMEIPEEIFNDIVNIFSACAVFFEKSLDGGAFNGFSEHLNGIISGKVYDVTNTDSKSPIVDKNLEKIDELKEEIRILNKKITRLENTK